MSQQQSANPAEMFEQYFINPDMLAVSCASVLRWRALPERSRSSL